MNNANNPSLLLLDIGDVSAGSASTLSGIKLPRKMTIKSAKLINGAAITGNDTNNVSIALREKSGPTNIATLTTDEAAGDIAAREAYDMAVDQDQKTQLLDAILEIDITHAGTGQALTGAKLQLEMFAV